MCGIVGLFIKNPEMEKDLGKHLSNMLIEMTERGPDSAGVAIYHDAVETGTTKLTVLAPNEEYSWGELHESLAHFFGAEVVVDEHRDQAVIKVPADPKLVHNGSLSNHNRMREFLKKQGLNFETDNDSEVAAGYYDDYQDGKDPSGISTQNDKLSTTLDPKLGGRRVANYLNCLTLELQTLARACGHNHVHNLEPEDMVALTMEAAAMAKVPLAGTGWIPGQNI